VHFYAFFIYYVVMKFIYSICKYFCGIASFAVGTVGVAEKKNFIHSDVDGVGMEGIYYFVNKVENYGVNIGVGRAPFSTVDAVVICGGIGGFIELGIFLQQCKSILSSIGLMTYAIKKWYKPYVILVAEFGEPAGLFFVEACAC